jgi:hypothetical protein
VFIFEISFLDSSLLEIKVEILESMKRTERFSYSNKIQGP